MLKKAVWILVLLSFIEFQPDNTHYNYPVKKYNSSDISAINGESIAVVGDLQKTSVWEYFLVREQNDKEREIIINNITKENINGLIILGDMVFNGSDKASWKNFDMLIDPVVSKNIPVLPVIGNHEYWGNNGSALKNILQRFPQLKEKHWLKINNGELVFIILDTNIDDLSPEQWNQQKQWFNETLIETEADETVKGVIVFTHHPPFSNSSLTGDEIHVQEAFLPAFNNSEKTLAFISGHAHTYERFSKNGKMFIVSGGGGGPRINLKTGADCHEDLFKGPCPRPFNYLVLTKNSDRVDFAVKGLDKNSDNFYNLENFTIKYRDILLAKN